MQFGIARRHILDIGFHNNLTENDSLNNLRAWQKKSK